jgi:hypothetical protein
MSNDFIQIGTVRIKRSNIKAYGVSIRDSKSQGLGAAIEKWVKGKGFLPGFNALFGGDTEKFLYITTYQNENHTFSEDQISIEEILSVLDNAKTER